jgi:hypothetical protein
MNKAQQFLRVHFFTGLFGKASPIARLLLLVVAGMAGFHWMS